MSIKRLAAYIFAAALVVIPGFSLAQTAPWWCSPQFASWWGTTSCNTNYGGAGLLVYVYIPSPSSSYYGAPVVQPSDFSVSVSGNAPTPASFDGSNSGTPVLLGPGSYGVTISGSAYNYTPSYSQGCSGTINAGQNTLCVITMSPASGYYPYPTPYGGSYNQAPIICSPSYQTVAAGQTARFEALGGYGPYTWTTAERTYLNVGSAFSVALMHAGVQTVIVQSPAGSASCTVNVVGSGTVVYPATTPNVPLTTYTYAVPLSYSYAPTSLANTGFEPMSAEALAFAVVGLLGAALIVAPYVRKTLVAAGF